MKLSARSRWATWVFIMVLLVAVLWLFERRHPKELAVKAGSASVFVPASAPKPTSPPLVLQREPPTLPVTIAKPVASVRDSAIQSWLESVNRPSAIEAAAADARRQTVERYAEFLAQNKLSFDQAERLFHLLDDKRQTLLDVAIASFQNGLDPRDNWASYRQRVADARASIDQQVLSLLGDESYQRLQAYDNAIERENVFTRLGRALDDTPNALSAEQTARLNTLLMSAPRGQLSPAVIEAGAGFFNPAQMEIFRAAYDAQEKVVQQRTDALMPGFAR